MIISSKDVPANAQIDADLVVIGAGAAGITIANRLAGTNLRIVVLESGPDKYDAFAQSLYEGRIVGQHADALDVARLRYLGGSTNHWGGWCRPLDAPDFEPRPDWPESGWPLRRTDLDAYYTQACSVCRLGPAIFDDLTFWKQKPAGRGLQALPIDPAKLRTTLFQISPVKFGETYRSALASAQNVRVILEGTVLELSPAAESHPDRQRKKAAAARVIGRGGNRFSVSGRAFVVATGGIETARLLLLSDAIHPAGAGNENDLVGRYFMDHLWMTTAGYLQFSQLGRDLPLYFDHTAIDGVQIFGVLASTPEFHEREGIGAFRIVLGGSRTSTEGLDAARAIEAQLRHGHFPDHLAENLGRILRDIDIVADSAYKTVTGSRRGFISTGSDAPYRGAFVDVNFEQRPNRDSRVLLDAARDAYGQRRVKLDWRLTETERRTATRALQITADELARIGLGRTRIRLDVSGNKPWPGEMMSSDHHSGTARMSRDPKSGVVDPDCRVHSMENLYVAGSAVFPTMGYANPTLTIVALSLRLADHLQQVLA